MELSRKETFEDSCSTNYIENAGKSGNKSKTVCQEKANRFKLILKGDIPAGCSPAFVFWDKKTQKFQLLTYEELDLKDALCLPAKGIVIIFEYSSLDDMC